MSDNPDCHLCPGSCPVPDCPYAIRRGEPVPMTDEDELGAAHEPFDAEGE